jgi:hypothetical protein
VKESCKVSRWEVICFWSIRRAGCSATASSSSRPSLFPFAEHALVRRLSLHVTNETTPSHRAGVVESTVRPNCHCFACPCFSEGQSQPQVDVRQKHRRLPKVPRGARRLADNFLDDRTAPTAMRLADVNWAVPLMARQGMRRSPTCLPARAARLPKPPHRYGLDLGFPYRRSHPPCQLNQDPPLDL